MPSKSLIRMFGRDGNPNASNFRLPDLDWIWRDFRE